MTAEPKTTYTSFPSVAGVAAAYPPPGPLRKSVRSHGPGGTTVSQSSLPSVTR